MSAREGHEEIVDMLICSGADINEKDDVRNSIVFSFSN